MKIGMLTAITAKKAGQSERFDSGRPSLRLIAVHRASGIIRQSVQTEIKRFKRRGSSTVLRAKSPPFSINLGSNQTSLNQPQQPFDRRGLSWYQPLTTTNPSERVVYRIRVGIEQGVRTLRTL